MRYARFGRRLGALAIDLIIPFTFSFLFPPLFPLAVASFPFFWAWQGQTPGMMAFKIRVLRSDGSKLKIMRALFRMAVAVVMPLGGSLLPAWIFMIILSGVLAGDGDPSVAIVLLGLVFAVGVSFILFVLMFASQLINRDRRTVYDRIAGTIVVDLTK